MHLSEGYLRERPENREYLECLEILEIQDYLSNRKYWTKTMDVSKCAFPELQPVELDRTTNTNVTAP